MTLQTKDTLKDTSYRVNIKILTLQVMLWSLLTSTREMRHKY